ncbi:MAG: S41 family peptidase [Desulfobacterales bacterium]
MKLVALEKLENESDPLKGLILDLRDNPGGLLDQAVKVADVFLDAGTIVSIRGREGKQKILMTHNLVMRPRAIPLYF